MSSEVHETTGLLATKLKHARLQAEFDTLEKAAKATGISIHTLKTYEQGKSVPSATKLKQMADIYQTSADWLLSTTDGPPPTTNMALVDQGMVEGILKATTEEEIRHFLDRNPPVVRCVTGIPKNHRYVSIHEALATQQRVMEHIQDVAPGLLKKHTEKRR